MSASTLQREVPTNTIVSAELTAMDRCDACHAPALVRVHMVAISNETELLFCGHHFNKSETKIVEQGGVVGTDNREHFH